MAFWSDLKNSTFSFPFYKGVAERPLSQGMKFLLKFVFVLTLILSIRLSLDALHWINVVSDWMLGSLPEITVTHGEASSPVQQPYSAEGAGKNFVFIFDTTGTTTGIPAEYPSGVLVTKKRVFLKENLGETREYDLAQFSGVTINDETITKLKQTSKTLLVPVIAVGLFLYLLIARLIQVAFFSVVSVVINLAGGMGLTYARLFCIGIYALVPCGLLGAFVGVMGVPLPWFPVVYASCYLTYLIIGVLQSKK